MPRPRSIGRLFNVQVIRSPASIRLPEHGVLVVIRPAAAGVLEQVGDLVIRLQRRVVRRGAVGIPEDSNTN